jgi:hypothetical protein
MRIGDLVFWIGRTTEAHAGESLHGVIINVCNDSSVPWYRVHWFEDNREYNYRMDDIDIQLVEKV